MRLVDDDDGDDGENCHCQRGRRTSQRKRTKRKLEQNTAMLLLCYICHFVYFISFAFFSVVVVQLTIQWNTLWRSVKMEMIFASMRCECDEWQNKKENRKTDDSTQSRDAVVGVFFHALFSFHSRPYCLVAWKCGLHQLQPPFVNR